MLATGDGFGLKNRSTWIGKRVTQIILLVPLVLSSAVDSARASSTTIMFVGEAVSERRLSGFPSSHPLWEGGHHRERGSKICVM